MNKVAIITGAGKGLGLSLCRQFLNEGYTVCALEINLTKELCELPVDIFTVDITDYDAIKSCRMEIEKKYKSVSLLINNAGVWLDYERKELEDPQFDMDMCIAEFDINAIGTLRMTREFLPLIRKSVNSDRAIVNLSSDCASYNPDNWRKSEYAYCMSKAAVNIISNLTMNAVDGTDIKIFSVFPGWMQTDMGYLGVSNDVDKPSVTTIEVAKCISDLVKGPKLEYTYCDRFGKRLY